MSCFDHAAAEQRTVYWAPELSPAVMCMALGMPWNAVALCPVKALLTRQGGPRGSKKYLDCVLAAAHGEEKATLRLKLPCSPKL